MAKKFEKGRVWRIWGPLVCFFLVSSGAVECNKSSGLNQNKANVMVIHTAPARGALDVGEQDGNGNFSSLLDSPISYGSATNTGTDAAHPYIYSAKYKEFNVGVNPIEVVDAATGGRLSGGSTTFNFGRNYSIFLFDDSVAGKTLSLFILPDNIVNSVDTFAYLRWLNFSPGGTYYNFQIRDIRPDFIYTGAKNDTLNSGFLNFVGNSEKISQYAFKKVHTGSYQVLVFRQYNRTTGYYSDSTVLDSLYLLRGKSYTAFVQGDEDSTGKNKLRLRVIQHD